MRKIRNLSLYILIYGISMLPMPILYLISDLLAYLMYNVVGYRMKIVMGNLAIAFPEKSISERKLIAKKFYSNFLDTMIESIKLISAGETRSRKMFVGDLRVLHEAASKGKNVQIHAMHNFNWEVVNHGISMGLNAPFLAVYQPIANTFFEKVFKKMRSRFGTILIPANNFKNNFIQHMDKKYVLALVADQNPGHPAKAYWVNFFGKPAPFVTGPEKAARQRDTIVVFANFYRIKRGLYTFECEIITEEPATLPPGALTLRYLKYLEDTIRKRPDNYLWSHRRWKHPYKPEYANSSLEKLNLP
jgi:KDO2-lipid IV(A) lauroyltransferase